MDETLTTIKGIAEDGTIDEWAVHTWPSEVVVAETTEHTDVVDTYQKFKAWADQWGVSLEPAFTVETRTSEVTGDERDVLVTPVLCLAVSVNGTVQEVFPHHRDETTSTVADALTLLTRGEVPVDTDRTSSLLSDDSHCPRCEGPLYRGQGLCACADCDWLGIVTSPGHHHEYQPEASATEPSRDAEPVESPPLQKLEQ